MFDSVGGEQFFVLASLSLAHRAGFSRRRYAKGPARSHFSTLLLTERRRPGWLR